MKKEVNKRSAIVNYKALWLGHRNTILKYSISKGFTVIRILVNNKLIANLKPPMGLEIMTTDLNGEKSKPFFIRTFSNDEELNKENESDKHNYLIDIEDITFIETYNNVFVVDCEDIKLIP